jgi:hypothetical protein
MVQNIIWKAVTQLIKKYLAFFITETEFKIVVQTYRLWLTFTRLTEQNWLQCKWIETGRVFGSESPEYWSLF